jgi:hypothetical protein
MIFGYLGRLIFGSGRRGEPQSNTVCVDVNLQTMQALSNVHESILSGAGLFDYYAGVIQAYSGLELIEFTSEVKSITTSINIKSVNSDARDIEAGLQSQESTNSVSSLTGAIRTKETNSNVKCDE